MITTYYQDQFHCPCGHSYIIKVPMVWASNHLDEFNFILHKQKQYQRDHFLCTWKEEIKAFLKQPVIVKVDIYENS